MSTGSRSEGTRKGIMVSIERLIINQVRKLCFRRLSFTTMWMSLEKYAEYSKPVTRGHRGCMILFNLNVLNRQSRLVVASVWGEWEWMNKGISLGAYESALKLVVAMVAQFCEHTQNHWSSTLSRLCGMDLYINEDVKKERLAEGRVMKEQRAGCWSDRSRVVQHFWRGVWYDA